MKKKYTRNLGKVCCDNCNKEFEKPLSELKRNKELNRRNFCSRLCVGKANYNNFGDKINKIPPIRQKDKYSGLRELIRRSKNRIFLEELTITKEYLFEIWENQNHKCIYTNIELILPDCRKKEKVSKIFSASLDRIDSKKGYIIGNVQFVSSAINYMKNDMSHEETIKLIELIKTMHRLEQ